MSRDGLSWGGGCQPVGGWGVAWVMLEFLKEVDLSSLVDRVGGLDVVVGWNWCVFSTQ